LEPACSRDRRVKQVSARRMRKATAEPRHDRTRIRRD
jgi:hypothetical protein